MYNGYFFENWFVSINYFWVEMNKILLQETKASKQFMKFGVQLGSRLNSLNSQDFISEL